MWEYKKKVYAGTPIDEALIDFTEESKDGWEVVLINQIEGLVIFKRKKSLWKKFIGYKG